jgi:hypothetical protein
VGSRRFLQSGEPPNGDHEGTKCSKDHEEELFFFVVVVDLRGFVVAFRSSHQASPMKTITSAGCFVIAVAVWLAGPRALGGVAQAPTSGLPAVDYSLGPDSQPTPGVPHGTLTRHILAPGKFFPGTPHNYQIYVPAQYTQGGKVFRREAKRTGVVAWEPVKPPQPGL